MNIQGIDPIKDILYRYKRRKFKVGEERLKTTIFNLDEIAEDLNRSTELLIEFFKKKFSIPIEIKGDKIRTKKKMTAKDFDEALKYFIEYFVLCPNCKKPETELTSNNGIVELRCICCSHNGPIKVDTIEDKGCVKLLESLKNKSKSKKKKKKRKNRS